LPGETSSELADRHQTDEIPNDNMAVGFLFDSTGYLFGSIKH
jgi:hypothetical protein